MSPGIMHVVTLLKGITTLCPHVRGGVAEVQGLRSHWVKSAIAVAREFGGKTRTYTGEHFWARVYAVSTVGFFEESTIRKYIREQEINDAASSAEGAF